MALRVSMAPNDARSGAGMDLSCDDDAVGPDEQQAGSGNYPGDCFPGEQVPSLSRRLGKGSKAANAVAIRGSIASTVIRCRATSLSFARWAFPALIWVSVATRSLIVPVTLGGGLLWRSQPAVGCRRHLGERSAQTRSAGRAGRSSLASSAGRDLPGCGKPSLRLVSSRYSRERSASFGARHLADRRCVGSISFLKNDKGLYRGGWDEPQFVCQIADLATPEMCAAAGHHRHNTRPRLAEEGQNLAGPQFLAPGTHSSPDRARP